MGNSLQDQLFKSGLASKKQAVRAKKAQNTKEKQQRKGVDVVDETADLVNRSKAEKLAKDKQLNQKINADAQAKAIKAQIVEFISLNRIEERGDIEFRYNDDAKIKTLMLQKETRDHIVKGILHIVSVNGQHSIVPRQVAAKIAERDDKAVIVANKNSDESDLDDEYADYKVPDDLMW